MTTYYVVVGENGGQQFIPCAQTDTLYAITFDEMEARRWIVDWPRLNSGYVYKLVMIEEEELIGY